MKYLLATILFLTPFTALALTGGSARFDFSLGEPSIVDNQTSLCDDTATVRYDFTLGEPSQVLDATATCTGAVAEVVSPDVVFGDQDVNIGDQDVVFQ